MKPAVTDHISMVLCYGGLSVVTLVVRAEAASSYNLLGSEDHWYLFANLSSHVKVSSL